MRLLDGRAIAAHIRSAARCRADALGVVPTLGVVVGSIAPGTSAYLRGLRRAAAEARVDVVVRTAAAGHDGVLRCVDALAEDPRVHGILVQTPLPEGIDLVTVGDRIPAAKDVDGMSPALAGHLARGRATALPATASAVLEILRHAEAPLRGAHAVVVGCGDVAGRPIALALLSHDATVTVCHAATRDVASIAKEADVLVVAVGRPRLVGRHYVKPGAVVVDVGINDVGGTIVGDVDTQDVMTVARAVTPVPGGVGPVTTAILLRNTVAAAECA